MSSDINLAEIFANLSSSSITIPTNFHSQCSVIKKIRANDPTGIIISLLNFQLNAASVKYKIETDSPELTKILNNFLQTINSAYLGKIPSGVDAISKEYYNERWFASGFCALKLSQWEEQKGLLLPQKMFIVDGASIYAEDKDKNSEKNILQYNYFLGKAKKNRLDTNVIFSRPYGRWFDKYPTPYLIENGVYHNYSIIKSLKEKQGKILNQIIPLILMITKGSEAQVRENIAGGDEDYTKILNQYGALMKKAKTETGTPTRATSFDEKFEHLIPNLTNIFDPKLFTVAEKGILGGMGFLDIAESVSSSRKESVLNPKPFIEETQRGVEGFKEMLRGVINLIKLKNPRNVKYMNADIRIASSPITAFITEEFRKLMRSLWKAGAASYQTVQEICGNLDSKTETSRILKEKKEGLSKKLYPPITENHEQYPDDKGNNIPKKEKDVDNIPDDKKDPIEKKEYKIAKKATLIGAPYRNLSELPSHIKKLSNKLQRAFMKSWNRAYYFQLGKGRSKEYAEQYAWRVANSVINKLKKKSKK